MLSLAAHPGYAQTNLQFAGPKWWEQAIMRVSNPVLGQSAEMGALPTLYAATAPDLPGGSFVGPDGPFEQRGYPKVVGAASRAYREEDWRRLWEVSEELTGVHYEFASSESAAKAFGLQADHQKIFEARHRPALEGRTKPNVERVLAARSRHNGKRILFIDDRVPRGAHVERPVGSRWRQRRSTHGSTVPKAVPRDIRPAMTSCGDTAVVDSDRVVSVDA